MSKSIDPIRVLVADDDPIFTFLLCGCLAAPRFSTSAVGTGADAMERLLAKRFDIALIDLDMPCIDGFRLIGLIRGEPGLRHLNLLVITGSRSLEDRQEAQRLGVHGFLSKPVDWEALPDIVSGLVKATPDQRQSSSGGLAANSLQVFALN